MDDAAAERERRSLQGHEPAPLQAFGPLLSTRGSFLLVVYDGGGTVPPALAITRGLVARGHQVATLGPADLQTRFEPAGSMAERAGATIAEVRASHVPMNSRPPALTDLILEAARTVD